MRMTHPSLPDAEPAVIPDDSACIAVHREAGWVEFDEPVQHHPGLMPGEVPPESEPQPKKSSKAAPKPDTEGDEA